jgi:hypothetical protein
VGHGIYQAHSLSPGSESTAGFPTLADVTILRGNRGVHGAEERVEGAAAGGWLSAGSSGARGRADASGPGETHDRSVGIRSAARISVRRMRRTRTFGSENTQEYTGSMAHGLDAGNSARVHRKSVAHVQIYAGGLDQDDSRQVVCAPGIYPIFGAVWSYIAAWKVGNFHRMYTEVAAVRGRGASRLILPIGIGYGCLLSGCGSLFLADL